MKYLPFRGKGYTCNICGAIYSRFVPHLPGPNISDAIEKYTVIAGFGSNVFCPNCLSTNRERLVLAILKDQLSIDGKTILHLSPEKHVFNFINKRAVVTTADIEPGFYRGIDKKVQYADIMHLPFPDNSFDIIIANHILEHIADDEGAMRELFRVLKKDGTAILQVPFSLTIKATFEDTAINNPSLQEKLFGQNDHVRIYAAEDYIMRLVNAGFKVRILKEQDLEKYKMYAIQEGEWVFMAHH